MPAGRHLKYTKKLLKEIEQEIIDYTEKTTIPILSECAYNLGMYREELYKHEELSSAIKKLITKKESVLEKGALLGKLNPSMAIFSLKQLGWRDKPKEEIQQENNLSEQIRKALGTFNENA